MSNTKSSNKRSSSSNNGTGPSKRIRRLPKPTAVDVKQENTLATTNGNDTEETTHLSEISSPPINIFPMSNVRTGKILRIHLRNFMCHGNFTMDFNKNVNLLVGSNGSGKSAVLTALIIGLGAKANATSRSTNIKQLIKRGESSATIEIDIANDGMDTYDKELYGEKITVTRNIVASGSSTYKMKDCYGRVVSHSRQDLLKLMLYMNIQVDNPVFVLNQDAARTFLKDSDPKKRYLLFLKATQIEATLDKLNECGTRFNSSKSNYKSQTDLLALQNKELVEIKRRHDHLITVEIVKKEIIKLKYYKCWIGVIEQENLLAELLHTINDHEKKSNELKEKFQNKNTIEFQIKLKLDSIALELISIKQQLLQMEANKQELRNHFQSKKNLYDNELRNCKKHEKSIQLIKNNIAELEKSISKRSESFESRTQKLKEDNAAKLNKCIQEKENLTAMITNISRDIEMNTNTKNEVNLQFNELRQKRVAAKQKQINVQAEIKQFSEAGKSNLSIYGHHIPKLVLTLEKLYKKGGFSRLPLGPLGRYIQVQESKWRAPIEYILGNKLRSFCVNSAKDRITLQKLLTTNFPNVSHTIIVQKFNETVYDVSAGQAAYVQNTNRAIDLMTIDNPVVKNILIDHCQIEKILLIEDQNIAIQLTCEDENVPKNLRKVILTNPFSEIFPAPNYRSYALNHSVKFLQVDRAQKKMQLTNEAKLLNDNIIDYETVLTELKLKLENLSRTGKEKNEQRGKFSSTLQSLDLHITELKNVEFPTVNEVDLLNNEMNELINTLSKDNEIYEQSNARCTELATEVTQCENQVREIKNEMELKENEIVEKEKMSDKYKRKLDEIVTNARYGERQYEKLIETVNELKEVMEKEKIKHAQRLRAAEKHGSRVEPTETYDEISEKLRSLEQNMVAVNTTNEDINEIAELLKTKTENYERSKFEHDAFGKTLRMMYNSRKDRYKLLLSIKQHMSLRVQLNFNSLLKLRSFDGQITIDHKNQTLDLAIVPRDKHIENAVSNSKCLSGGERSYSTVAFLLALWSCVDHPFYFLDEYDVFTDQINRMYLTKLLLNEASKKPNKQYVFLTPQDMSSIEGTDELRIHKLNDPHRD